MWNVISLAAILNFVVTSERPGTKEYWEVWEFTKCSSTIIHLVCPPPAAQNFANAFFTRCFQQNIFRTFMGSINTESTRWQPVFFFVFFVFVLFFYIKSKLHLIHHQEHLFQTTRLIADELFSEVSAQVSEQPNTPFFRNANLKRKR